MDVFVVIEANLTTEKLNYYQLNSYTLYNLLKYRQTARGILIGVSNSLCTDLKTVKEMGNSEDKSEIVKVNVWKQGNNFTIYTIHNPPKKPDFTSLTVTSKTTIMEDFNAHSPEWGYKDTNTAGKELEDLLNTSTLELIYDDTHPPTYLHYNGALTTPDLLLISSDISTNAKRIILDDPGSGHKLVVAEIPFTWQQKITDPHIKTSWNFKKANWESFKDMLEINLHQGRTNFSQHPDKIGKVNNSSIIKCAKACIPRGRVKRYKCFWTDDLETLKNQREYFRKRAEHTGKIEDVQAWRRQAAVLRKEITEFKQKFFKNFITHINYQNDSQKTYKYVTRIQNNAFCNNKIPIHENDNVITSDRGIANTLTCTFSRVQKNGTYAKRNSKIVKREYKTRKQKNGSAKPAVAEDILNSSISDCRTPRSNKTIKQQKISWRGPNTCRILKACRERSKNLNMYVVSKNLGNRYGALTLAKSDSSTRTEIWQTP